MKTLILKESKIKTLIINGSPRINGNTQALIKLFAESLKGEYKIINAYSGDISPCTDCRGCQKSGKCRIKDGMEEVYGYTKDCDNILIASPVYFSELTPPLLGLLSRFQAFYCSKRFLGIDSVTKKKKGGILLTGGGDGGYDLAERSAKISLKIMGAKEIFPVVYFGNTDLIRAEEQEEAVKMLINTAESFNGSESFNG